MKPATLFLVTMIAFAAFAEESPKKPLVWDGDKIAAEANRKYTGYEKYLKHPIGTATLIRNGKVIEKGPYRSFGYTAGDTVHLSKGLHLVDLSKRATEVSEDVRIGDVVFEGKARGRIVIEGEGADSIIIDAASIKEKRPPKVIRFAFESSEDVLLKNITFVNSEWDVLRDPDGLAKMALENIRFEGSYKQTGKLPIKSCLFCVFEYDYWDLKQHEIFNIGSVIYDGTKYVEIDSGIDDPAFKKFVSKLVSARRGGTLVNGADSASARDLYLAVGEGRIGKLGLVEEQLRNYLTSNYKFEIPKNPKLAGIMSRSRAQLKAGRPLLASLIVSSLPKDMDKAMEADAKKLIREITLELTKTYNLCAPVVSTLRRESVVERVVRGGLLTELVSKKVGGAMDSRYPILLLADPGICKMNFHFHRNTAYSKIDDTDQTVARDIVEDLDAVYKAEQARNSAMLSAAASIGSMAKGMADSNERMWRQTIDKSTHFEQHVGGTDLVSWKMDRSVKFDASKFATKGPSIPSGFTKQVDRIVVNYRFLTKPDLQAKVIIEDRGKKAVTELARFNTPFVDGSCQAKYEINPATGGRGEEVPPEMGKTNDCPRVFKFKLARDLDVYTTSTIMPIIDNYVAQFVMPAFEKAVQRSLKSKSVDDRAETALMMALFKQELDDDMKKALRESTGADGSERVLLAAASANFAKMTAVEAEVEAKKIKEAPFPVRIVCDYPISLGHEVKAATACGHLYKPADGKPIVLKTEGVGQYSCKRMAPDAGTSASTTIYDVKLGNIVIAATTSPNPRHNEAMSVEDWNLTFGDQLTLPFGHDPANPQYAYQKVVDQNLTMVAQLELKKSGSKFILGDSFCAPCNAPETAYVRNPPNERWKKLQLGCEKVTGR